MATYHYETLWGQDAEKVAAFVKELAAFQRTNGVINPDVEDLAFELGPNGMLTGIGVGAGASDLVGAAITFPVYNTDNTERSIFLLDLFVDNGHRAKGVGLLLMQGIKDYAITKRRERPEFNNGYRKIYLDVQEINRAARAFYKKIGAVEEYPFRKDGHNWIRMKIIVDDIPD